MRTIFTLLWSSLLACSVVAQTPRPAADTCLTRYRLSRAEVSNCDIQERTSPYIIEMVLLGKSLTDGFQFNWRPNQINGYFSTSLFAYNGTTTPIPGVFQACPGNWVYFKGRGFRKSVQNANTVIQYQDVSFRVRYWGSIQKPDSLKMEYKSEPVQGAYVTIRRDSICDKCLATDKTPPQITGCPSATVELPMPANPTKVNGNEVMKQVGIKVTDNCSIYNATNYPYSTSVTNGQTIDYKTVVYDPSGNRSVCRFKVRFASPLADTCFPYFNMDPRQTETCDGASRPNTNTYYVHLLGKRITDGFRVLRIPITRGDYAYDLFGTKGTTTPPDGSTFIACPGNWTYFTVNGIGKTSFFNQPAQEVTNWHARIKYFGNESNPDSLKLEWAAGNVIRPDERFFNTRSKQIHCNSCQATDKIAPVFQSCPTQTVIYPAPNPFQIAANEVARFAQVLPTDNCILRTNGTFPNYVSMPFKGQIIDFHSVAYDDAANKSICKFKVQIVAAPCSLYTKPFLGSLESNSATVMADAGQTCKVVTWAQPIYTDNLLNPTQLTSNYPSGHCFPIGTTSILYTLKDSCGAIDTARFYVTVQAHTPPSIVINPLNAMVYEQKVKLSWAQLEDSIAHVEVQKLKRDGSDFETIHPSIAPPSGDYQVGYDELPVEGANDYRLKTIFKNGKVGYSPTQRVDYQKLRDFTIFPNPTDGIAFLDLKAFENLKVELSISDVAGKVLSKQIIENASVLPHRLDVSKLEKGTYFVQIQTVGKQAVTRPLYVLVH